MFNLNGGVQNYTELREPMGGSETRENAARTKEVLASIGRGLREQYAAPQPPLTERLAELVRKIEQSTHE